MATINETSANVAPPPTQSAGQTVVNQQPNSPLRPPALPPTTIAQTNSNNSDTVLTSTNTPISVSKDDANKQNNTDQTTNTVYTSSIADNEWVKPQSNVLDQYPNYTYVVSLYMLSAEQYNSYVKNPKSFNISSYNLIIQSGGSVASDGTLRGNSGGLPENLREGSVTDKGRNPSFPLDYYIDDLEIETTSVGKGTGSAHSGVKVKFNVVEPYGISLIDNLYKAAQDLCSVDGRVVNYKSPSYLLVVKFYGYDANGKIITPIGSDASNKKAYQNGDEPGKSDKNSIIEKFYPLEINTINWKVRDGVSRYDFEATIKGMAQGLSTMRGTIPADIQLTGSTVGDMLEGDPIYSTATTSESNPGSSTTTTRTVQNRTGADTADPSIAEITSPGVLSSNTPAKASAATSKSYIRTGLMQVMNEYQEKLRREGGFDYKDTYTIEWAPDATAIRDSTVTKPGSKTNKATSPMSKPTSVNTRSVIPESTAMNVNARNRIFPAGMQVVQAIELIISQSDYIYKQASIIFDENTNKLKPNPRHDKTKEFSWFNILVTATQGQYDFKRNDFVYDIKFTIKAYKPKALISQYFNPPSFRGVHKSYPYWFTGKNTSVISYEANFSNNYLSTVTAGSHLALQNLMQTSNSKEIIRVQAQARSTESSQGGEGRSNEPSASAKEYLYSANSNAEVNITIIGDPAWMQQGVASGRLDPSTLTSNAFLSDGTIAFDSVMPLFEIVWQKPQDYSLTTGLADPYVRDNKLITGDREPIQRVTYQLISCRNIFKGGKFVQELKGGLVLRPISDINNAQNGSSISQDQQADFDGSSQGRGLYELSSNDVAQNNRELARTSTIATSGGNNSAIPAPNNPTSTTRSTFGTEDFIPGITDKNNQFTAPSKPGESPTSNNSAITAEYNAIVNFLTGKPFPVPPKATTTNINSNGADTADPGYIPDTTSIAKQTMAKDF